MSETVPIAPVRPRIVVDKATGKDGNDFYGCFFLETDGDRFDFYNQEGELLRRDVHTGEEFHVKINGVRFLVFRFHIAKTAAHGHFIPLDAQTGEEPVGMGEEPEGSFQASSGPGAATDDVYSVSAQPPPGAIVINIVKGTSDKEKLKGMYFVKDPGPNDNYNLYNKKGKWIESGIQSGITFTFQHDSYTPPNSGPQKIVWTVTDFLISSEAASGNWTNNDHSITAEPEGGSFQASSGPGAEEEEAASAASA